MPVTRPEDFEMQGRTSAIELQDPLGLRARVVEAATLEQIHLPKLTGGQKKRLRNFYETQNEEIDQLLKPMEDIAADANEEEDKSAFRVQLCVWASMIANVCLAGLQLYAAISSLSLSFFATAADSVFDPFASIMLAYVHRKSKRLNPERWPTGGSRLETVANILYSFLMITVNVILVVESIRALFTSEGDKETNELHIPALVAVCIAFATKFSLFCICWTMKAHSSQVQILWEDHRNDLPVNAFGILTNAGGAKLAWQIDPAGALCIAIGVIISWVRTMYSEFQLLIGKTASPDFLRFIIYKAMTYSDDILAIDSCKAYYSGPDVYIELDVVMSPTMPLNQAHDIAQSLQDQLETCPGVARVFVHQDYEVSHAPEHRKTR